jgi:hypothetical protein
MSDKRQLIVVAGALGALAAAIAVTKLLKLPEVRQRLGLDKKPISAEEAAIDMMLDDSFPASDPPSFSPITSVGGTH